MMLLLMLLMLMLMTRTTTMMTMMTTRTPKTPKPKPELVQKQHTEQNNKHKHVFPEQLTLLIASPEATHTYNRRNRFWHAFGDTPSFPSEPSGAAGFDKSQMPELLMNRESLQIIVATSKPCRACPFLLNLLYYI